MSLATTSALTRSSIPASAPGRSNTDDDESNNDVRNISARTLEMVTMDRQPLAPRRSISPVQRRVPTAGIDTTLKSTNTSIKPFDSDDDGVLEEDLEYIAQLYGGIFSGEDNETKGDCSEYIMPTLASHEASFAMPLPPPPPPMRHINEDDSSPYQQFGKTKHEYDRTRQPQRSAMRKPNSKIRNVNSIDNSKHKSKDIGRGISRNHSADGTEDTRRGTGSLHSVRMRGSILPVHRRQSIGFKETVRVQEITPIVELNDGNTRDLWLQADEAMEIKERRRSLLKRYKEREARKKNERRQKEQEKNQQKVKNLLNPAKNNLNNYLSKTTPKPRWSGIMKRPDLPLPDNSQSGRRWKATAQNDQPSAMGLSVPSRGGEDRSSFTGLYMGNATSSFLSTSSGGSSFSGHGSDSFRGLEKYIDRSGKHQKNMVWDAVFIEQDEQLQYGYYDDERIATLYRTVQNQHDGQQKAEGRAQKDRKAADNYLMTPRTLKLMKKTINVNSSNGAMSSLMCGDLLEDDAEMNNATNDNSDSGLGNHGKTDSKDEIDTDDKTRAVAGASTPLKGSGKVKRYNKFLRRLSV